MSTTWQDATKFDPDNERPQMIEVILAAHPDLDARAVDLAITRVMAKTKRHGRVYCALLIAQDALDYRREIRVTGSPR